jgi:putative tryptophan/tyrosine transport system substrate-binding protein
MRRRTFLGILCGAASAWPLGARAQERIARIGFLTVAAPNPSDEQLAAGLRDLGWVEGENLNIEHRAAGNDEGRLPLLAAELVGMKPDAIVAVGPAVIPVSRATSVIAIVAAAAPDLVAMGMAASLAHPGGNITGQLLFLSQYVAKRLEFLKAVAPSLARAGVLLYRGNPLNVDMMRVASQAAGSLGVELQPIELDDPSEFESAFPPAPSSPIGGFVTTDHPLFVFNAAALAGIAQTRSLPWIGAAEDAAFGALMGYGADFPVMVRYAAIFVDKILRGADPGDIPIEQVTEFRTIANLKTARAIGVEIPPTLLAAADEVIE